MHAALELNDDDGGNRRVILCTNNENNICRDITYERLKTAITGVRTDGSRYSDGFDASLKYMKIDYVAIEEDGQPLFFDEYSDELLQHVRELVELENGIDFSSDSTIKIALSEDEVDVLVGDEPKLVNLTKLYIGHDVLLSDVQKDVLKSHSIEVSIIPEYYYANEVGA